MNAVLRYVHNTHCRARYNRLATVVKKRKKMNGHTKGTLVRH